MTDGQNQARFILEYVTITPEQLVMMITRLHDELHFLYLPV